MELYFCPTAKLDTLVGKSAACVLTGKESLAVLLCTGLSKNILWINQLPVALRL